MEKFREKWQCTVGRAVSGRVLTVYVKGNRLAEGVNQGHGVCLTYTAKRKGCSAGNGVKTKWIYQLWLFNQKCTCIRRVQPWEV
jgi:hypothetical protein